MVPHVINQIRGNKGVRKSHPNSGKKFNRRQTHPKIVFHHRRRP